MPRTKARLPIPALVRRREACVSLGIVPRTFSTHWTKVFTDPRAPEQRVPRVARHVYEDELAEAVHRGGRTSPVAKAAVLLFRKQVGRT